MTKTRVFTSGAHMRTFGSTAIVSIESTSCVSIRKVIVQLSIEVMMVKGRLKLSDFDRKIEGNFAFHLCMHEVTVSWQANLYGTSTPARACLMVGSVGSTQLSSGQEAEEYIQSQSIIFHVHSYSDERLIIGAVPALSSIHSMHIMTRSGYHPCML